MHISVWDLFLCLCSKKKDYSPHRLSSQQPWVWGILLARTLWGWNQTQHRNDILYNCDRKGFSIVSIILHKITYSNLPSRSVFEIFTRHEYFSIMMCYLAINDFLTNSKSEDILSLNNCRRHLDIYLQFSNIQLGNVPHVYYMYGTCVIYV